MRIKALSGPYAGKVRNVGPEIDSIGLLMEFARHDWRWEVYYATAASEEERFLWGRADLAARIARALFHLRPVRFMGHEYRAATREDASRLAGKVEDAIVDSGMFVTIEGDDQTGVTVAHQRPD